MRRSLALLATLVLGGCFSDTADPDPYSGMDCKQKIEAIVREVQEFEAAKRPAAKVSAQPPDSVPTDSAKPDSTKPDSTKPDSVFKPIQVLRGWPPVSGLDPNSVSIPTSGTQSDSRDGSFDTNPVIGTTPGVQWIPPVGFKPGDSSTGTLPDTLPGSTETTPPSTLPKSFSAVRIVSQSAYIAHIRIYDRHDALIRTFDQTFGYHGELANPNRVVPDGFVSYLVWDNKDASGGTVPSGVYLWRVRLAMGSGTEVEMETLTGYIGEECTQAE